MPIYEYEPDDGQCTRCQGRFELLEKLDAAPLTHCPHCAKACHRVVSAGAVIAGSAHVLRESHFAERGFSQYRRVDKGKYEKTAGPGPDKIES